LGCKVHLRLHVTVNKDWTKNPRVLRELGLG
jgi:GTPase Era involved in 16S rRNA processing